MIRTVPRFGYAFQETHARDQEPMRPTAATPRRRRIALVLGGFALCAFAAYAAFSVVGAPAGDPPLIRLAVLPFQNLTGDPEQDYLDGLTEDMIVYLGGLQPSAAWRRRANIRLQYKPTSKGADEIGRELGVRFFSRQASGVLEAVCGIAVRLFDAERQTHVWAEQHDYDLMTCSHCRKTWPQQLHDAFLVAST